MILNLASELCLLSALLGIQPNSQVCSLLIITFVSNLLDLWPSSVTFIALKKKKKKSTEEKRKSNLCVKDGTKLFFFFCCCFVFTQCRFLFFFLHDRDSNSNANELRKWTTKTMCMQQHDATTTLTHVHGCIFFSVHFYDRVSLGLWTYLASKFFNIVSF